MFKNGVNDLSNPLHMRGKPTTFYTIINPPFRGEVAILDPQWCFPQSC